MTEENVQLRKIIEGAILAAGEALSIQKIQSLFVDEDVPEKETIIEVLQNIRDSCEGRGYNIVEVASGWRFRVNEELSPWVNRLWDEKPQKYSRALLETLSLVAYRQPLTRGDIEEVRGVAVSSHIIKTLTERDWVKVVGHRDVPGRPALYATTRAFLDYFNLKSLDELPILSDLKDIESLNQALEFDGDPVAGGKAEEGEIASSEVEGVESETADADESPNGDDSAVLVEDAGSETGESSDNIDAALEADEGSPDSVDDSLENADGSLENIEDFSESTDGSLGNSDGSSLDVDEDLDELDCSAEDGSEGENGDSAIGQKDVDALSDESNPGVDDFGLGERSLDSASSAVVAEEDDISADEPDEAPQPSYASLFQDSAPLESETTETDVEELAVTENEGLDSEAEKELNNPECVEGSDSSSDNNTHDETDNFEQTAQPDEAPVND